MARKFITIAALAASLAAAVAPASAMAHDRGGYGYDDRANDRGYYRDYDRRGYYADSNYRNYDHGYYGRPAYRCRGGGSTGAIFGAIAGGLLGNGVAGRGDRTLGTVIGAGGGAIIGSAIERSGDRC
jgi:hypothetical protein